MFIVSFVISRQCLAAIHRLLCSQELGLLFRLIDNRWNVSLLFLAWFVGLNGGDLYLNDSCVAEVEHKFKLTQIYIKCLYIVKLVVHSSINSLH